MYEQRLQEVRVLSMKRTLTALTVVATMFASSASAFDPDDLQKLKDTGNCQSCDMTDVDLSYQTNLSGANLGGAFLDGANLYGAYMNGAILCNTTMPDGSVIYSGC